MTLAPTYPLGPDWPLFTKFVSGDAPPTSASTAGLTSPVAASVLVDPPRPARPSPGG